MSYQQEYERWRRSPDEFWLEQAKQLTWFTQPSTAYSENDLGQAQWFADGVLNSCYLALDAHIDQGRGDQVALIYDSPVTNTIASYTFLELRDEVAKFAGVLQSFDVAAGDTVVIYMPMIPQAAIAMLACARIGAIHSVVFGGFAAIELARRIDDAKPALLITASCGIEVQRVIPYLPLINEAIERAEHKIDRCIVLQRDQHPAQMSPGRDYDWQALMADSQAVDCVPLNSSAPLYILYTSGTTGKPKGVVRDNGGHATALGYSMSAVYDVKLGDVFWSASDVGWVVGHSYIVYAPLMHGCTSVFYEGKPVFTPDAGAFWRVIEQHKVNVLFSAPTAFRAIRREDSEGTFIRKYDTASLRRVFAAGERLDPTTQQWMTQNLGVNVIDNWWQTETGWPICANLTGVEELPIKFGSATKPAPGYDVRILDDKGNELPSGEQGKIAIKLPLPPSCLNTIWNDYARYHREYLSEFPGYYSSGDGGYFDADGYLFVMGRVDDVINVAGHRLSTGDIEEVIARTPAVAECAVVAKADELKGELPVGFVVLSSSYEAREESIAKTLAASVRSGIGAIACYRQTIIVARLPKTRSGKILRKTLKSMLNEASYVIPPTIEDPTVLTEIQSVIDQYQPI